MNYKEIADRQVRNAYGITYDEYLKLSYDEQSELRDKYYASKKRKVSNIKIFTVNGYYYRGDTINSYKNRKEAKLNKIFSKGKIK